MSHYKSFSKQEGPSLLNNKRSSAAASPSGGGNSTHNNMSSTRRSVVPPSHGAASASAAGANPADATIEAAAHLLRLAPLDFEPTLDFLSNNRVVAVIEKAVERLQLLGLLDVSGPPSAETEGKGGGESAGPAVQLLGTRSTGHGARGAAVLAGNSGGGTSYSAEELQNMRRTAPAISAVLAEADATAGGRGRASVNELLAEQRRLEKRYGELLRLTQKVEPPPGEPLLNTEVVYQHYRDPETLAHQQELKTITAKLKAHHKLLCTQLRDNPNDVDNWHKVSNEREELAMLLQSAIAELIAGYDEASSARRTNATNNSNLNASSTFRNAASATLNGSIAALIRTASGRSLTSNTAGVAAGDDPSSSQSPALLKRFGSTMQMRRATKTNPNAPRIPLSSSYAALAKRVLEEKAAQLWADELIRKERELNQNVKQLQSDLLHERNKREKEMAERRARLVQLRGQLRDLKRSLRERSDAAKAREEAATEGQQRAAADVDRLVTERMDKAERLAAIEKRSFELFKQHLQSRAAVMDGLAEQWDKKNQIEIKRMEMTKMDTEQQRQHCADRLAECERQKQVQEEEKAARDAAVKEEADLQVENAVKREEEYAAASKLESAIKGMFTRTAINKALKKKGKKKKG